jgi:hypothetical protein
MAPGNKQSSEEKNSTRTVVLAVLVAIGLMYVAFSGGSAPENPVVAEQRAEAQRAETSANTGIPANLLQSFDRDRASCDKKFPNIATPNATKEEKSNYCECVVDLGLRLDAGKTTSRDVWLRHCQANILKENAPEVKRLPMHKVTDAELATIPADKLEGYKSYCDDVMKQKAKEYGSDPEVFKQLNDNLYRHCLMERVAPAPIIQ